MWKVKNDIMALWENWQKQKQFFWSHRLANVVSADQIYVPARRNDFRKRTARSASGKRRWILSHRLFRQQSALEHRKGRRLMNKTEMDFRWCLGLIGKDQTFSSDVHRSSWDVSKIWWRFLLHDSRRSGNWNLLWRRTSISMKMIFVLFVVVRYWWGVLPLCGTGKQTLYCI